MRNISDRFLAAVKLCTGAETAKQRLSTAWTACLDNIGQQDLPDYLRQEFSTLRNVMYAEKPQPTEDAPTASVRKMSPEQAAQHTATILRLALELFRVQHSAALARDIASPDANFDRPDVATSDRLN